MIKDFIHRSDLCHKGVIFCPSVLLRRQPSDKVMLVPQGHPAYQKWIVYQANPHPARRLYKECVKYDRSGGKSYTGCMSMIERTAFRNRKPQTCFDIIKCFVLKSMPVDKSNYVPIYVNREGRNGIDLPVSANPLSSSCSQVPVKVMIGIRKNQVG